MGKSSYAGESQVNHDLAEKRGERHSLKDKVDIEGKIEYNIGNYDLYNSTDDFYNTVPAGDGSAFARSLANKTT